VELEAHKIMTLATESTNMLENIEHVFSKTVSAAEYTLGHKSEPVEAIDGIFSPHFGWQILTPRK